MNSSQRNDADLLKSSSLFDPVWYTETYKDVGLTDLDPLEHFIKYGGPLARSPHKDFDSLWYLEQQPGIAEAKIVPVIHFLRWGRKEGRKTRAVGARYPTYSLSRGAYGVNRKNASWDHERQEHFVSAIEALYEAQSAEFSAIKVSIVMPTYNRADIISKAIESVVVQSHRSWELIIVDDGSTDNTQQVIGGFAHDQRVKYVRGAKGGVSKARNIGLRAASGEFVFYLDSDNEWHPDFLRIMICYMRTFKLDAAYCGAKCMDDTGSTKHYLGDDFDWLACYKQNYVDMNCFGHSNGPNREIEFNENLRRLVDWDLILGLTGHGKVAFAPFVGVNYYDGSAGVRITKTEYQGDQLQAIVDQIRERHRLIAVEKEGTQLPPLTAENLLLMHGADKASSPGLIRAMTERLTHDYERHVGYVLWDWPALSQTFVLNEIRWLIENGRKVTVFYKVAADNQATVNFDVAAYQVKDSDHLAQLIAEKRVTVLHSPFAYPATTLLTWPAAVSSNVPFVFMPGGVDIAHYENMKRNRIAEVASSDLCLGVITLGTYYRDFLIEQGVPSNKIVMERQAVGLPEFRPKSSQADMPRIITIGRFIEKKGIAYLVEAAQNFPNCQVIIYGYGPLETTLRLLVDELGLKNVEFAGALNSAAELHAAYANADLFVLPCVRASNGDMDGLPTVILEAMAAGVPVISTRIANNEDVILDGITGFLADTGDVESLSVAIKKALGLSATRRRRMLEQARLYATSYASVDRTMGTLEKLWSKQSIDIVLVTYDTEKYDNWSDTKAIIDRLYRFTSMPFQLYVVDNKSQSSFIAKLKDRYGERQNFHLIELESNVYCGPASNIGIEAGTSKYVIYVCSKEGFVLNHGWEWAMVRAMDNAPNAAIGGHQVLLPKFPSMGAITAYPSFARWRNTSYAEKNKDAAYRHVQGGLYILRRDVYRQVGGFNDEVPHDGMDVEYSYYLESCGFDLLDLEDVYAISSKTLPPLTSLVDEKTLVVHPSTCRDVNVLDAIVQRRVRHCNLCAWQGETFSQISAEEEHICANCGGNGFDRTAYKLLSSIGVLQKRPSVFLNGRTSALDSTLSKLCRDRYYSSTVDAPLCLSDAKTLINRQLIVIDRRAWGKENILSAAKALSESVTFGATVVVGHPLDDSDLLAVLRTQLEEMGVKLNIVEPISDVCQFDPYPVYWASR